MSKSEQIRKVGFGLIGVGAGACAGMVVKAGLDMITPPALTPVTEVAYKAGKWVLASLATVAIEKAVTEEITTTVNETIDAIKEVRENIEPEVVTDA